MSVGKQIRGSAHANGIEAGRSLGLFESARGRYVLPQ